MHFVFEVGSNCDPKSRLFDLQVDFGFLHICKPIRFIDSSFPCARIRVLYVYLAEWISKI